MVVCSRVTIVNLRKTLRVTVSSAICADHSLPVRHWKSGCRKKFKGGEIMIQFILDHGIYFLCGVLMGTVIGSSVRHYLIKHGVLTGEKIATFTDFFN